MQITEVSPITPSVSPDSDLEKLSDIILQADTSIVVCNPLTTSLPNLLRANLLLNNSNLILVLTCAYPPPVTEPLGSFLSSHFHVTNSFHSPPKVLSVDPPRALSAIEALTTTSLSSSAVQKYQDDFLASRISELTALLSSRFASGTNPAQTALVQIRFALSACNATLQHAKRELNTVSAAVSHLKGKLDESKAKIYEEVFGRPGEQTTAAQDEVVAALDTARKDIKEVMDRLTWFRMLSRLDEISDVVAQAVEKRWCQELEKQVPSSS